MKMLLNQKQLVSTGKWLQNYGLFLKRKLNQIPPNTNTLLLFLKNCAKKTPSNCYDVCYTDDYWLVNLQYHNVLWGPTRLKRQPMRPKWDLLILMVIIWLCWMSITLSNKVSVECLNHTHSISNNLVFISLFEQAVKILIGVMRIL